MELQIPKIEPKNAQVNFRMTEKQLNEIKELAKKEKTTLSQIGRAIFEMGLNQLKKQK